MTAYRSGIRDLDRTATKDCTGCGKPETRSMTFRGVGTQPEDQYEAWLARPWYHARCWRTAGRPAQ